MQATTSRLPASPCEDQIRRKWSALSTTTNEITGSFERRWIMKRLSAGASWAWQIAAGESAAAGHQYIEKEHVMMGICSLAKVLSPAGGVELNGRARAVLQAEWSTVEDALNGFELDPTLLRRQLRTRLGRGTYRHSEGVVHRSEACKRVFQRAGELAQDAGVISCLHLLAALLLRHSRQTEC